MLAANEAHWKGRGDELYSVLKQLSSLQDWAVDAELESWIEALQEALQNPSCAREMAANPAETLELIAWLTSPTALNIMETLDAAEAGTAARLYLEANQLRDNAVYRSFIEGLDVLHRSRLLSKVFAPDRMALVEAAVRAVKRAESNA